MITVIIAGGSGTRLWPISTPNYPKHLLEVNDNGKTLVQNTYERVKSISSKVFVITDSSHAHHVKDQLTDLDNNKFIIEPARRGTASCILAGIAKIAKLTIDEPIAFIAADHYIRDMNGFTHSFKIAQAISKKENKITLVGVEPDHPATGFGYIEKGGVIDDSTFVFSVKAFKEKPDYTTAKKYVKSGNYLWNCGYFVGSVNAFLRAMETFAPKMRQAYQTLANTLNKKEFENAYLKLDNTSIDYALIEKVKDLLVVPANFDWMDLGSYADLHKATESDDQGNNTKGDVEISDVQNSFIQNYEDKPMAIVGLDNIVVINTKDGVLVARKDLSQNIGEIAKKIQIRKKNTA